uniref:Ig-like domain-containing protein n=1 Tax=Mola mola TaxID=94237 RepID=A0A3Q3VY98_MOLML
MLLTSLKEIISLLFYFTSAQTTDQFSASAHQMSSFISVKTGDKVTLRFSESVSPKYYWYKHSLAGKPKLISSYYKYANTTFHNEFVNNLRFMLDVENGKHHLIIKDLRISDSATYYCLGCYGYNLNFVEGITVSVKGSGSNVPVSVYQSASETIQPGDSVTLNCTVQTGTCDGQHSVYWFRNSAESHPGLIYTQGGRNDQCERNPDTQTHTCVYNLSLNNLNLSHAGTYYCAVASYKGNSHVLVYFLSGALAFTTTLIVLLSVSVYKMMKKTRGESLECQAQFPASSTANTEGDDLHYAALSINLHNGSRKQRDDTNNECVYSSVKQ